MISIVIPTYNESKNLPLLIRRIDESLKKPWIIIVDDNSPDGTGNLAEALALKRGNMMVIHRKAKLGLGSAYREGFKFALNLRSSIIFTMDADLSHDPHYLPQFLEEMKKGWDVVIGSRWVRGGSTYGLSFKRKIVSLLANLIIKFSLRLKSRDCTSGFRAYRFKALRELLGFNFKAKGYFFQVEILYFAKKRNLKIGESPIVFYPRRKGKSKLRKEEIFEFLSTLLRLIGSKEPERLKV